MWTEFKTLKLPALINLIGSPCCFSEHLESVRTVGLGQPLLRGEDKDGGRLPIPGRLVIPIEDLTFEEPIGEGGYSRVSGKVTERPLPFFTYCVIGGAGLLCLVYLSEPKYSDAGQATN